MKDNKKKYRDFIQGRFPGLACEKAVFDFSGDPYCDVVTAGREQVFKFARYDWSAAYLANEIRSVRFFRQYADLAMPEMTALDPRSAVYRYPGGKPLARDSALLLDHFGQESLAKQIAFF